MATVICQYTGIAFEAGRSYEKNHPRIRDILKTALTVNMYGSVVDRLRQAREAGLTDLDMIVDFARTGDPHNLK